LLYALRLALNAADDKKNGNIENGPKNASKQSAYTVSGKL